MTCYFGLTVNLLNSRFFCNIQLIHIHMNTKFCQTFLTHICASVSFHFLCLLRSHASCQPWANSFWIKDRTNGDPKKFLEIEEQTVLQYTPPILYFYSFLGNRRDFLDQLFQSNYGDGTTAPSAIASNHEWSALF